MQRLARTLRAVQKRNGSSDATAGSLPPRTNPRYPFAMATFFTALFGALLGAGSNVFLDVFRRINDGRALAAMLAAEISAMLDIVEKRDYVRGFKSNLEDFKAGRDYPLWDIVGDTAMWEPAYRAGGDKVGLLGPYRAALVTRYYRFIRSIMMDLKRLGDDTKPLPLHQKIHLIEGVLTMWLDTEETAREAVQTLNEFANRSARKHILDGIRGIFSSAR